MIDYQALSDEELVRLCKTDPDAEPALLYRYRAMVKAYARPAFFVYVDIDDLVQTGMIALHGAIRNYDESKNASFKTYANACVKYKIIDAVRTTPQDIPLIDENTPNPVNFIEKLIEGERNAALHDIIKATLSEKDCRIFSLYIDGLSYVQIAENLGLNAKQVDNSLQKTKSKLKKTLLDADFFSKY